MPLFKGEDPASWRSSVYYHYYEHNFHGVPRHEGIFDGRYKLINYYSINEWELFDLDKDPQEMNNVFKSKEYSEVVEKMKNELSSKRKEYDVPENEYPPYY
jgi:hypothetical protein